MGKIDIEIIMQEIRDEINLEKKYEQQLSFQDKAMYQHYTKGVFEREVLELNLSLANINHFIPYEITGEMGGIKGGMKKILFKMTKFYMVPLIETQREVNGEMVRVLNNMYAYMNQLESEIEDLRDGRK